ncbi:ring-cleaving dioxygenase [Rubellimicrobium rubrum]|uniref:Ring-cleaving dioxygenase n=1 Tax=Rubellimicrobium rubrum TaxID=2585369 RepID=A0A5C4MV82_9RHOB|nr:VOC family protein [Rubellimicrobium rubrum]TNC48294.1 ring-cleaving dioxygenase [Rubellimicrobium rubrum]
MTDKINGLHHVTMLASGASANNAFYTEALGLRRVKTTVNFDAPDVYHLYFGDELGRPGTVMTSFPFPNAARGRRGTGEASLTAFAVPVGSLPAWEERLAPLGPTTREIVLGDERLLIEGPDGESLALVEVAQDARTPWTENGVGVEMGIRGFHSVTLTLQDIGATADLLRLMGYREEGREGPVTRMRLAQGNGAQIVDLHEDPTVRPALQSAGSVHHIAFSVADKATQAEVRRELAAAGFQATPSIDRDYFWAIYFRSPGGVLFEIATDEPGFTRDEAAEVLGTALKLPQQHAHLHDRLVQHLEPLEGLS